MNRLVYVMLRDRYNTMAKDTPCEKEVERLMQEVAENCLEWHPAKVGRWVGYAQCLLINVEKITTVDAERAYTRPLFKDEISAKARGL